MDEDGIIEQRSAPARLESVVYPDSDDEPMAENMVQADAIRAAYLALKGHFLSCPNRPLLAGAMLMYYVEGDPTQSVAPDVMAVFGVGTRRRSSYKLWEERKAPDFILEVSSPSSREKDRTTKADLYASLGVREYFLFDPGDQEDAEDLEDPEDGPDGEVLCYRSWGTGYLECGRSRSREQELQSETLGLRVRPVGTLLRFRDLETGKDLPLLEEQVEARQHAEEALQRAESKHREETVARRKAEEERRIADSALQDERTARINSETRVAELEALLAEMHARSRRRESS